MPTIIPMIQPEEEEEAPKVEVKVEPPYGTIEWIYYWSEFEGDLPTPIDISITGSIRYKCPELKWFNFDVFPHKMKLTNTGYTGSKWKAERPYLEGGPFLEKHIFSQIHFHWGSNMMEGSEHSVDKSQYPGEMQATFFKSEYMTQDEAFQHDDGVVIICYIIKGAQTHTRIGPYPLSRLMPMFFEDYFLYWGSLKTVRNESYVVRWLIPRITLFASLDQINEFRKLWNPWDEPNLGNYRPLQEAADRHIFFINPHWNQYNSLLPIPRLPEPSISVLSPAYEEHLWLLPPQNAYMLPPPEETPNKEEIPKTEER